MSLRECLRAGVGEFVFVIVCVCIYMCVRVREGVMARKGVRERRCEVVYECVREGVCVR